MKYGSGYIVLFLSALILFSASGLLSSASAEDISLDRLKQNVISYFKPVAGSITSVSLNNATATIGAAADARPHMRLTVFREGAPFLHPVTKEPFGRIETLVGVAEISEVGQDSSTIKILKGDIREGDKARISANRVRMLFYQHRSVEWALGESYYERLKESGRFELADTSLNSDDIDSIIAEGRRLNAEVVLFLTSRKARGEIFINQQVFWSEDGLKFAEYEAPVEAALLKELKFGEELFKTPADDALLYFDLPFGVTHIAAGDFDGNGRQELMMSTGKDLRAYEIGVSLQNLWEIKGTQSDNHIYMDAMDFNRNGKDELTVTSLRGNEVVSSIYELKDGEFSLLYKGGFFVRRVSDELLGQMYDPNDGFSGNVFKVVFDGEMKKGPEIILPRGINLYDFVYVSGPSAIAKAADVDAGQLILAYDEKGYLNLYDEKGLALWSSRNDYGGFLTTFKRTAPTVMVDRGEWSVKDRLLPAGKSVLAVKRIPLANMSRGLGYKSSKVINLLWNGVSMEERVVVDNINGGMLDMAISGERLMVLSRPLFGIKPKNILKGENPLGSVLYIYGLK